MNMSDFETKNSQNDEWHIILVKIVKIDIKTIIHFMMTFHTQSSYIQKKNSMINFSKKYLRRQSKLILKKT